MHSDLGFRNLLLTLVIIFLAKYQVTSEWEHSKAVVLYSQSRSSGNNSTPDAALEVFFLKTVIYGFREMKKKIGWGL